MSPDRPSSGYRGWELINRRGPGLVQFAEHGRVDERMEHEVG